MRHVAACERRWRTTSHPCGWTCGGDAAARRSWGPSTRDRRAEVERPDDVTAGGGAARRRVRASETDRKSEANSVVEALYCRNDSKPGGTGSSTVMMLPLSPAEDPAADCRCGESPTESGGQGRAARARCAPRILEPGHGICLARWKEADNLRFQGGAPARRRDADGRMGQPSSGDLAVHRDQEDPHHLRAPLSWCSSCTASTTTTTTVALPRSDLGDRSYSRERPCGRCRRGRAPERISAQCLPLHEHAHRATSSGCGRPAQVRLHDRRARKASSTTWCCCDWQVTSGSARRQRRSAVGQGPGYEAGDAGDDHRAGCRPAPDPRGRNRGRS